MLQTVQDFERWKKAGVLLPFKPDGFDKIDAAWKDVGRRLRRRPGQRAGLRLQYPGGRQGRAAHRARFPETRVQGQDHHHLSACRRRDALSLFAPSSTKHGSEFLDKLKAERAVVRARPSRRLRARSPPGEKAATFDAVAREVQQQSAEGKPIAMALSETEPMPVWAQSAGVFKDAPHPNAAKLFIAWYLQPEQQRRVGHWPSRSDVPPPEGLKPLAGYNLANAYRTFIMDEPRVTTLRERALKLHGSAHRQRDIPIAHAAHHRHPHPLLAAAPAGRPLRRRRGVARHAGRQEHGDQLSRAAGGLLSRDGRLRTAAGDLRQGRHHRPHHLDAVRRRGDGGHIEIAVARHLQGGQRRHRRDRRPRARQLGHGHAQPAGPEPYRRGRTLPRRR